MLFLCNFTLADDYKQNPENLVIVYYFHGNFRCPTCLKIEQHAKEAVEKNFKQELSSGKVIFKAINVDEKKNEHFIHGYQLYTKSLVISLVKNGNEEKYENLSKIWEYVRNKDKFFEYVKSKIIDYLKEIP